MYQGFESAVGIANSLKVPEEGKKRNTLFEENSVPKMAVEREIVVVAMLVGSADALGSAHSWKVLFAGSK